MKHNEFSTTTLDDKSFVTPCDENNIVIETCPLVKSRKLIAFHLRQGSKHLQVYNHYPFSQCELFRQKVVSLKPPLYWSFWQKGLFLYFLFVSVDLIAK